MPKERTVRLKPNDYKPSKVEMEEPIRLPMKPDGSPYTPEEAAGALMHPVRIIRDPD